MDDVCITFHVIANSSVRKQLEKQKQNSAWLSPGDTGVSQEQLGSAAHVFPRLRAQVGISEP